VSRELREVVADWLMLAGALVLAVSLFLTWSHQFSPAFAAAWAGSPVLRGVPRDPTAWQVYSVADVCLAVLAAAIVYVAVTGTRRARVVVLVAAGVAMAFVVHALAVPPTAGLNLPSGPAVPDRPSSGAGEVLALVALGTALAGLALSFTDE